MATAKNKTFESRTYALTLSPPARWGDIELMYDADRFLIRRMLNRCTDHYIMYPDMDKNDRLHYHGIVVVKDYIKWNKETKTRLKAHFNFIKVEYISSHWRHVTWLLYSKKEWHWLSDLLDRPIMPRRKNKVCRKTY